MSDNNKFVVATTKWYNIDWGYSISSPMYRFQRSSNRDIPEIYHDWDSGVIDGPSKLTVDNINKCTCDYGEVAEPRYIFFPHWSWKIPKEVYEKYECIAFHMTDLPYGRGGSPLQNMIVRRQYYTVISAFRVVEEMDAGPIYLKHPLLLEGTADEILKRASDYIFRSMIPHILANRPVPVEQQGDATIFKRRTPAQSNIAHFQNLGEIYDHIRMLDGPGYPPAFIETSKLRVEFTEAKLEAGEVEAKVKIKVKE